MRLAKPPARFWLLVTGIWGLLSLAPAGCKRQSASSLNVRVTRVVISDIDEGGRGALSESDLHAAAQRGLQAAGVPVSEVVQETRVGDFQLRMQVQTELQPDARTLRMLCAGMLSARQPPPPSDANAAPDAPEKTDPPEAERAPELSKLEHVGLTEKTFAAAPDAAAITALARRLVEDTAHTLGAQVQLLGQESRALIAFIGKGDSDPEVRKTAIELLGQRKEKLALPILIAIVKERPADPSKSGTPESRQADAVQQLLRDTAIGALVEIGDQSAVRPLLDSVAFRDHVEMGKLVAAVATLGGDEARRYLQFVRGSHPDSAIRAEAEAALKRLEQHAAAAQKTSPPK